MRTASHRRRPDPRAGGRRHAARTAAAADRLPAARLCAVSASVRPGQRGLWAVQPAGRAGSAATTVRSTNYCNWWTSNRWRGENPGTFPAARSSGWRWPEPWRSGRWCCLLDEPVSALDEQMRDTLCRQIKDLQRRTGTTTIHVCHNFAEMLAVADRVGVIHDGRIVQLGTPQEILQRPRNRFVAHFVQAGNVLTRPGRGRRPRAADRVPRWSGIPRSPSRFRRRGPASRLCHPAGERRRVSGRRPPHTARCDLLARHRPRGVGPRGDVPSSDTSTSESKPSSVRGSRPSPWTQKRRNRWEK